MISATSRSRPISALESWGRSLGYAGPDSGGGAVSLTLKGTYEVLGVKISPEAVDPEDVASLEDLIIAAAHDAVEGGKAIGNVIVDIG